MRPLEKWELFEFQFGRLEDEAKKAHTKDGQKVKAETEPNVGKT